MEHLPFFCYEIGEVLSAIIMWILFLFCCVCGKTLTHSRSATGYGKNCDTTMWTGDWTMNVEGKYVCDRVGWLHKKAGEDGVGTGSHPPDDGKCHTYYTIKDNEETAKAIEAEKCVEDRKCDACKVHAPSNETAGFQCVEDSNRKGALTIVKCSPEQGPRKDEVHEVHEKPTDGVLKQDVVRRLPSKEQPAEGSASFREVAVIAIGTCLVFGDWL